MKSILYHCSCFLLFFLSTATLSAQAVFNKGWAPQVGHVSQNLLSTVPDDGLLKGANQLWDFSGISALPGNTRFSFSYLDPANTPYQNLFPDATIAAKVTFQGLGDQYAYYRENNDGYETLGSAQNDIKTLMEDTQKGLCYPLAYGDSFSDDYSYTTESSYFSSRTTATSFNEYDGYGKLQLPQGDFDEVARYTQYRNERDSFGFAPGFYSITVSLDTTTGWLISDYGTPLALLQRVRSYTLDYSPGQSSPDTTDNTYDIFFTYDDDAFATTSSSSQILSASNWTLFPNPPQDVLYLTPNDLSNAPNYQLQIINSLGQNLWASKRNVAAQEVIPIEQLAPGSYWLRIETLDTKTPVQIIPFVKQ